MDSSSDELDEKLSEVEICLCEVVVEQILDNTLHESESLLSESEEFIAASNSSLFLIKAFMDFSFCALDRDGGTVKQSTSITSSPLLLLNVKSSSKVDEVEEDAMANQFPA